MTPPDPLQALSALQLTRLALARWSGVSRPALARDVTRVSPQARHLEQARRDLAAWIANGGFDQSEAASPSVPARTAAANAASRRVHGLDACID